MHLSRAVTGVVLFVSLGWTPATSQVRATDVWNFVGPTTLATDPPGTREAALGGAGTLLSQGAAAAWWNPARLAGAPSGVTAHSYALYPHHPFGQFRHRFIATSLLLDWRDLGLGLAVNRAEQQEHRFTGEEGQIFRADLPADVDISVSLGMPLGPSWSVGASLIHVRRDLGVGVQIGQSTDELTAWGGDFGLVWRAGRGMPLSAGVTLDHVGSLLRYDGFGINEPLPATTTLALAVDRKSWAGGRLSLAGEAVKLMAYKEVVRSTRYLVDGQPAFWDNNGLTRNPWSVVDGDSLANEPAYELAWEAASVPGILATSWFRHGVREELHQAIYRLGAEYERVVRLPAVGEVSLALRGGRRVMPAWDLRSWTWGVGVAWRGLSVDASVENQERRERTRFSWDPWDGTRRLSLGWHW